MALESQPSPPELKRQLARLLAQGEQVPAAAGASSALSCIERLAVARHVSRPKPVQLLHTIASTTQELHGDRLSGEDPALWAGFATLGSHRCVVLASNKGCTTEERMARRFGMMNPEGYRKAQRVMRLAERFRLPVITLVDTAGAYSGLEAEERGQGWAIAETLALMSELRTPILSVIVGEGCSGGALGIAVADWIALFEHAYFSVISPEGCSSILWRDRAAVGAACESLKMQAEHLYAFRLIDQILPEPAGGGHQDPERMARTLEDALLNQLQALNTLSLDALVARRQHRYRTLHFEPIG